jgi:hypothetical protein
MAQDFPSGRLPGEQEIGPHLCAQFGQMNGLLALVGKRCPEALQALNVQGIS